MTKAPEAVMPEVKPVRRRKRKSWFHRLKDLTDIRREKKNRIATQVAIYGLALLALLALVYMLIYFGL